MKVKKFICTRCLAPKVNKIETAYVVCDYCASLMDVDMTVGVKEFFQDTDKVVYYEQNKTQLEQLSENASKNDDVSAYVNYRNQFWTLYFEVYPDFALPTINTPKLIEEWCILCAKIDAFNQFKENADEELTTQTKANQSIEFYEIGDSRFADWDTFFHATQLYHHNLSDNLKQMREVPEFSLLDKMLPLDIAIKKEMSTYAQMWIPYLEDKYHDQLLDYLGLKTEYIDIPPVEIKEKSCKSCQQPMQVPEGAIISKCNHCNTDNVWSKVACTGCGAENELPEDWQETITCTYCTVETRVINRLYG